MNDFWAETAPPPVPVAVWPPVPEPSPEVVAAEALLEREQAREQVAPEPPADPPADPPVEQAESKPVAPEPADPPVEQAESKRPPRRWALRGGPHALTRYDWPNIKRRFVEGIRDQKTGVVDWPSLADVAAHFNVPKDSVYAHSAAEGWVEARRQFAQTVELARQRAKAAAMAASGAELEGKAMSVAQLGLQLVGARMTEIGQAAQRRRTETVGSGVASGIDAQELQRIASAADLFHRIGLRAVGDPEVTRVELTGPGGGPVEIAQELRRDDPSRLADVLSILKTAGVDQIAWDADVVDGEVAEDDAGDGASPA